MLQRSALTNEKLPMDHQIIEVRLGQGEWQPATFRDGEFVDAYGMSLDRRKVSGWRPASSAANRGSAANVNHA
jgi:hypothetical protein